MHQRSLSALLTFLTLVLGLGVATAPAAGAAETITVEAQAIGIDQPAQPIITASAPVVTGIVFAGRLGSYQLDWAVSDASGTPVAGAPSGTESGTTEGDGSARFPIDGSLLPDGEYWFTGTITVDNAEGQLIGEIGPGQGHFLVDRTAPDLTSFTASRSFVRAGGDTASYGSVTLTATGAGGTSSPTMPDEIAVFGPAGTERAVLLAEWVDGRWSATFQGRDDNGTLLPRGTYTLRLRDAGGNTATRSLQVTIERLERRTFERTITVTGSQVDKAVGACSRLATPASRGWSGSHGYYANTRCDSTRPARSVVSTLHRVSVPTAARYHDFQVTPYSGASRGAVGSVGVLGYLTRFDESVDPIQLGPALGPHTGPATPLAPLVRSGGAVRFFVGTANFNRYDVRSFRVVAHYSVWR